MTALVKNYLARRALVMTKQYVMSIADELSVNSQTGRLYFKGNRAPLFGKFVKLKDHDELLAKGFTRFVTGQFFHLWQREQKPEYTRLIQIDNIYEIKVFK